MTQETSCRKGAAPIDETTLLVGSAGAAYVFEREQGSWVQKQKLATALAQPDALFGSSVAIEGDTILVGASGIFSSSLSGAVYVFHRDANGWSEQTKLLPPASVNLDHFGASVAIQNNVALVGAPGHSNSTLNIGAIEGAAYLFSRDGEIWTYQQTLSCPDETKGFDFGHGVAIDGDIAVIASLDRYFGTHYNEAVAYVFQREAETWSMIRKIPEHPNNQEELGVSVALSQKTLLLGSPGYYAYQYAKAGSARVYVLAPGVGDPCNVETLPCAFSCQNGACSNEVETSGGQGGSVTCADGEGGTSGGEGGTSGGEGGTSGGEAGCSLRPGSPSSPAASWLLWALFCLGVFRRRLAR